MSLYVDNTSIPEKEVKNVIIKTLKSRIEEINNDIINIKKDLSDFEDKYGLSTEEFYKNFLEGKLGDKMDFFEWKASKKILDELLEEKKVLLEAIR